MESFGVTLYSWIYIFCIHHVLMHFTRNQDNFMWFYMAWFSYFKSRFWCSRGWGKGKTPPSLYHHWEGNKCGIKLLTWHQEIQPDLKTSITRKVGVVIHPQTFTTAFVTSWIDSMTSMWGSLDKKVKIVLEHDIMDFKTSKGFQVVTHHNPSCSLFYLRLSSLEVKSLF